MWNSDELWNFSIKIFCFVIAINCIESVEQMVKIIVFHLIDV